MAAGQVPGKSQAVYSVIVSAGRSGLREAGADWLSGRRGEPESGSKAGVELQEPEGLQGMEKQDTDAEAAQQLPLEVPGSIPSVGCEPGGGH